MNVKPKMLPESVDKSADDSMEVNNDDKEYEPCFTCNGFYGPCYEDPICQTCHNFLYCNITPSNDYQTDLPEDTDDEDSGNDEPEDNERSGPDHGPEILANDALVNVQPLDSPVDIEQLPPEVMMLTFSYLDDISMWAAAKVNSRWRDIIMMKVTTQNYWLNIVAHRWPLFVMAGPVVNWFEVYSSLVESSCCLKCLRQNNTKKPETGVLEENWRFRRLGTELKVLKIDPPDGIKAHPLDDMYCNWMATMKGPEGSPYEGGIFFLYIHIPYSYPMTPPLVRFITKIYHPNISRHGDIGLDSILNNWSLALTICKVLISIQSLLTDPVCEICMEPQIGELYLKDRTKYEDNAREWTWKYAMTQLVPQ